MDGVGRHRELHIGVRCPTVVSWRAVYSLAVMRSTVPPVMTSRDVRQWPLLIEGGVAWMRLQGGRRCVERASIGV